MNSWDKEKQADEIIEDLSEYQDAFMAINGGSLDMYSKKLGKAINTIFASGFPSSCNPFFMRLLRAVETNPNFENEAIKIFNSIESFLVRRQSVMKNQQDFMLFSKDCGMISKNLVKG